MGSLDSHQALRKINKYERLSDPSLFDGRGDLSLFDRYPNDWMSAEDLRTWSEGTRLRLYRAYGLLCHRGGVYTAPWGVRVNLTMCNVFGYIKEMRTSVSTLWPVESEDGDAI